MLPALQPVQGGRERSASSPASTPTGSTSALGRAAGTDPMTTTRCSATAPPRCPTTSPSSSHELLAYLEDTLPARPSRSRGCRPTSPAARNGRSRGCSAPPAERASGPPSWASPTRSPTSSTRTARHRRTYRARFRTVAPARRPQHAVAAWVVCRRHRRGGRAAARASAAWRSAAAPRAPDPGPAADKPRCASWSPGRGSTPARRRAPLDLGAPATVRAGLEAARRRVRRERGDRGHDHPRPRGPAPLLRAARRRLRAHQHAVAHRHLSGRRGRLLHPPLGRPPGNGRKRANRTSAGTDLGR